MPGAQSHLYHATPLHYLPHIFHDGALYAQSVLAARSIAPRPTAKRRDGMLGLADYVRLSPTAHSPLLADKIRKGYPHALLIFDAAAVLALPGTSLLPYNTKAWRTRAVYEPIVDAAGKERLLRAYAAGKRFASLEVLVKYGLPLNTLQSVSFLCDAEHEATSAIVMALKIPVRVPLLTRPADFPDISNYQPVTREAIQAYFAACHEADCLLPPPAIPFD